MIRNYEVQLNGNSKVQEFAPGVDGIVGLLIQADYYTTAYANLNMLLSAQGLNIIKQNRYSLKKVA